jgi:hypothetical protein
VLVITDSESLYIARALSDLLSGFPDTPDYLAEEYKRILAKLETHASTFMEEG